MVSNASSSILRYDGTTGAFIDAFVASGSGGLSGPVGVVFGPDGNLYVAACNSAAVLRYNGMTGAFINVFASGGLNYPHDAVFGPDGNLYVSSAENDTVVRFNGISGAFIDNFVPAGSGGLDRATDVTFGPDGKLYVVGNNSNTVQRYDGTTGSFFDVFVDILNGGLSNPVDIVFGPDGNAYVTSFSGDRVTRYVGPSNGGRYFVSGFRDETVENLNFGNFKNVTLSGQKFEDNDDDAFKDSGVDQGLQGWMIELDLNCDGNVDQTSITDVSGNYSFPDVGPGQHKLTEQVLTG